MSGSIALASDLPGPPGAPGDTGASGAGATGLWQPSDNGLVAANFDPALCNTNFVPTAGLLHLVRVRLAVDSTISSIKLLTRSPAASGLANAYLGLYSTAGALLASTADVSAGITATGPTSHALSSPLTDQVAGTNYYVGLVIGSGTTMPTIQGPTGGNVSAFLTAATLRAGHIGTGQSALPASFTPANVITTTTASAWFAGLGA